MKLGVERSQGGNGTRIEAFENLEILPSQRRKAPKLERSNIGRQFSR